MSSSNDLELFQAAWQQKDPVSKVNIKTARSGTKLAKLKIFATIALELLVVLAALWVFIFIEKDLITNLFLFFYVLLGFFTLYQVFRSRIKEIKILALPTKEYRLKHKKVLVEKLKRALFGIKISALFAFMALFFLMYELVMGQLGFSMYIFATLWSFLFCIYYFYWTRKLKRQLNM